MAFRIDPYPGADMVYPSSALYPGVAQGDLSEISGYVIANTGSAVPYALLLAAEQVHSSRRDLVENIQSTAAFLLGAPNPGRARWTLTLLVRTLEQAGELSDLFTRADWVTITEWRGRALTAVGDSKLTSLPITGQASWWTLTVEVVEQWQ